MKVRPTMPRQDRLSHQLATLSPIMARRARIAILDWSYKQTSEACTAWRKARNPADKGLDYRTIVKIENGQLVGENIALHLRKTYEEAGVIFTDTDVCDQTREQRSLKINGYKPLAGHIHQSVDRRLKEVLSNADSSISAAQLMSRIVEQGLRIVTPNEPRP